MKSKNKKPLGGLARRDFIRLTGVGVGAGLAYLFIRPHPAYAGIRPPGALEESFFRGTCLRCGLCAEVCDREAIRFDNQGLPYLDGLQGWCDFCMCCMDACPTTALTSIEPENIHLGTAVIDRNRCIAWNWPSCRLCFEKCTELQDAIWLDEDSRPHIDEALCNGCGACVFVCPQSAEAGSSRAIGKAVSLQSTVDSS